MPGRGGSSTVDAIWSFYLRRSRAQRVAIGSRSETICTASVSASIVLRQTDRQTVVVHVTVLIYGLVNIDRLHYPQQLCFSKKITFSDKFQCPNSTPITQSLKQVSHWHVKRFTPWHAIWRAIEELVILCVGVRGDAGQVK